MAKLRPRARIVRTIGDQLISGPEAALIELVKNAYDADSPSVHIQIVPPGSLQEGRKPGRIIVMDTGHGMTAADLIDKWFEPATTDKVERRHSPGERRMLGAKGVGRFAAARLGRYLSLRCAGKADTGDVEVSQIEIDWSAFEKSKYLDQIEIAVNTQPAPAGQEQTGVTLDISELRDAWTQRQLTDLVRELRRLASPQRAQESGFRIFLDLTGFTKEDHGFDGQSIVSGPFASLAEGQENSEAISGDVEEEEEEEDPTEILPLRVSDVFHYKVEGTFDRDGAFMGTFLNQRAGGQEHALNIDAPDLAPGEEHCGSVSVRINIYDREGDSVLELLKTLGLGALGRLEARRILDENIGVGIYRGGFRIRPYGDAETDWLELERLRVQNPSRKLGLNQVWGVVDIEPEETSRLVERSSREGLEHTGAFSRLKRLIADLMARAEDLRVTFREMAGISRRPEGDTGSIRTQASLQATSRAIAQLPPRFREPVERALKQEGKALRNAIDELEAYQQKLNAQSSLGLVVSQVLHDGRRFLGDIATRSQTLADGAPRLLEESTFGDHFRTTLKQNAESIQKSASHITKLFRALDPLAGRKRGRPKELNAMDVVASCVNLLGDSIRTGGVEVVVQAPADLPRVTAYEADLMAALLNIIDNAVHWLGTSTLLPRQLSISAKASKKWVRLHLSNNGPAIQDLFRRNLFTPGFSLKPDGSGLGLAIAREAMRASKGNVLFDEEAQNTTFVIEIQRA